jgi:hypothetical protein
MSTADERLKQVTAKITRAKEHVADLERERRAFLDTNPFKVAAKRDPETRKLVYYVMSAEATPDCLPLIAGDAIQNLMSALDHLAYQLVWSDTAGHPQYPDRIHFPVGDDKEKYEKKKRRHMKGAHEETLEAIDAMEPYKGGNNLLWALYRLNNIDKHRMLFTVGSQAAGINVGQLSANEVRGVFPADTVAAFEAMNAFLIPADKGFPLKAGFVLYIGGVDEEPNPNQQFRFEVVLSEPEVIDDGKPLLETASELTGLVEHIVTRLTPRLR